MMPSLSEELKEREREVRSAGGPFDESRPHTAARIITDRLLRLDDLTRRVLKRDGDDVDETIEPILQAEEEKYWSRKAAEHTIAQRLHIEKQYRRIPFKDILKEEAREIELLPTFGRTGLADRIVIGYNVLCTLTLTREQRGAWPLILGDLLENVDKSTGLISDSTPNIVSHHPSSERVLLDVNPDELSRLAAITKATGLELSGKVGKLIEAAKKAAEALKKAGEYFLIASESYERLQKLKEEARRKAEEEREAERKQREVIREIQERTAEGRGHELPGSRDHVDAFERNGDLISRTC
jgi:hypothetical protein